MKNESASRATTAGWLAKVGKVLLFTVALSVFMNEGWFKPREADARITTLSALTSLYSNSAYPSTISYTVPAGSGSNRLLVVAVSSSTTAAIAQTCSVTYGTRAMTQVRADGGSTQSHSYLFYLNEAELDLASNTNLVFTISGGTGATNGVYAGVFDGVDQTTPIYSAQGNTGTTSVALTTAASITANDVAVEAVNMSRLTTATYRTISTPATGWTISVGPNQLTNGTVYTSNYALFSSPASDLTTTANHSISSATASLYSMSAMGIKRASPTVTATNPNSMTQGAGPTTISIIGSNFQTGATVTFSGNGISLGAVSIPTATTITVPVTVNAGATTGARNVTVTNTDGLAGTGTGVFTVNASGPTIPILTSPTATAILATTATLGSNITSTGGAAITQYGTCWGTTAAPTGNCSTLGAGAAGVFTDARTGLTAGTQLYYRGYATNSAGTGYSPDGSFYTEPATQASGVLFSAVTSSTMTVSWTRGSGSGVIVLVKAGSAVNSDPVDGIYTGYTANAAFGSGTQIGTGNYVVYKGTATSVNLTGLSASTTYYVAAYEYAGTVDTSGVNQGTSYKLTPATGSQATAVTVTIPTLTTPTATSILATTATLGSNITSTGGAAITQYGTCWGTTAAPTGNCSTLGAGSAGVFTDARTGLPASSKLFYRGYATNSAGTGYSSDGSFYTEPATQASVVSFASVSFTTMTVSWTRGTGTGVIVLAKAGSAVNSDPVDGTYTGYTANAAFGSGTNVAGSGSFVVYKGTGTSVAITGLSSGTTYYYAVYEYTASLDTAGDNQGANYKMTPATGSQATSSSGTPPAVPTGVVIQSIRANQAVISWNTVTGASSYNVYRSTDGITWGSAIGSIGAPPYTDSTAPKSNTKYWWTVTSFNGFESAFATGVSGRTALSLGYNMVSAPYDTTDLTPVSVFGSWADWAWDWKSNSNSDTDGSWVWPQYVRPAAGFFVWAYNDSTLLTTGLTTTNSASMTVTLVPGWNIISNHQTTDMTNIGTNWLVDGSTPLSAAITATTIGGSLSWWDGVQYQSLTISLNPVIEPWKSYFILNNTGANHTLTIK